MIRGAGWLPAIEEIGIYPTAELAWLWVGSQGIKAGFLPGPAGKTRPRVGEHCGDLKESQACFAQCSNIVKALDKKKKYLCTDCHEII